MVKSKGKKSKNTKVLLDKSNHVTEWPPKEYTYIERPFWHEQGNWEGIVHFKDRKIRKSFWRSFWCFLFNNHDWEESTWDYEQRCTRCGIKRT